MSDRFRWMDATEQAEMVRTGQATPAELVEAAIARLETDGKTLNVLASERFERARKEATGALPEGPFRGVPMLLKDLGAASAGDPHHSGSFLLKGLGNVEQHDASLTRRIREAGFVILGRTNTPEFGIRSITQSIAYGITRNPWNLEHSTGGSSGASAAAVAAGLVPLAEGSDGAGSLRMPAVECGVLAIKPSRGRISESPDGEIMAGHNVYGACSRSVRDLAGFLDVVAGMEPGDPTVAPPPSRPFVSEIGMDPGRLRVGFADLATIGGVPIDDECRRGVRDTAAALERLGHDVSPEFPEAYDDDEYLEHFIDSIAPGVTAMLRFFGTLLGREVGESDVEPSTWYWYERGLRRDAGDLAGDLAWMDAYRRRFASWWASGFDLLVAPAFPVPAQRIDSFSEGGERTRAGIDLIRTTAPVNTSGQPALAVPAGTTTAGLPVGVQLVAAYGREDLLFRVGSQLEEEVGWRGWKPPAFAGEESGTGGEATRRQS